MTRLALKWTYIGVDLGMLASNQYKDCFHVFLLCTICLHIYEYARASAIFRLRSSISCMLFTCSLGCQNSNPCIFKADNGFVERGLRSSYASPRIFEPVKACRRLSVVTCLVSLTNEFIMTESLSKIKLVSI